MLISCRSLAIVALALSCVGSAGLGLVDGPVSKTPIQTLKGHTNVVFAVAFSHNGRLLATAGDSRIILWDTSTWMQTRVISSTARSIAFSIDDNVLATDSGALWAVSTGMPANPPHVSLTSQAFAFSPDGKTAAASGSDGRLSILDSATWSVRKTIVHSPGFVTFLAYSQNGKILAVGNERSVTLYDVRSGQRLKTLKGAMDRVTAGAFSLDDKLFATGGCSNFSAQVWDVRTGKIIQSLRKHRYEILSLAFSRDGKWLATGSVDATAILWNVRTGKAVRQYVDSIERVYSLAFSPDGKWLATGDAYGKTMLWRVP